MSGQHKESNDQTQVPISIVLITVGLIILMTAGAIWLISPAAMPAPIYAAIQPFLPQTIVLPTPASQAALPEIPLQSDAPPEITATAPAAKAQPSTGLITMAEALEQQPLTGKPVRIVIPAIDLDAPVADIGVEAVVQDGQTYYQWLVPDAFMAGWHNNSARLGETGNTVLNGHHNIYGEVFRDLVDLEEGDEVVMYDDEQAYKYLITDKEILPERGQPLSVRLDNAKWIAPTEDERITLVTCWPYTDNSHRLIVVAKPAETVLSQR